MTKTLKQIKKTATKRTKSLKKLYTEKTALFIMSVSAIVLLSGSGSYALFSSQIFSSPAQEIAPTQSSNAQPKMSAGTSINTKLTDDTATIDSNAQATSGASSATPTSTPKVPAGMKKIPTATEDKAMHACIDRDAAAYSKYYSAHSAEVQRHQGVLATLKQSYDKGGYKFINNPYGPNDDTTYQSDIAAENVIFQQNTAAIYSTYTSEKSTAQC